MDSATAQLRPRFTVYYGTRRFLLLAPSFVLDRHTAPYRRLSATLLLACRQPFRLEAGNHAPIETRAALIGAQVPRRRIVAHGSDVAIFDMPIDSAEYQSIRPIFRKAQVLPLDTRHFETLMPLLRRGFSHELAAAEVASLFDAAVMAVGGHPARRVTLDPRVHRALAWINGLPLDFDPLPEMADRLRISPSRLRHLFQEQLGTSVGRYHRWAATWRAAWQMSRGCPLTQVAHDVGFYDLPHMDHAFSETFGLNPSLLLDPGQVTLVRCPEPGDPLAVETPARHFPTRVRR